jgi:hypothetical protein
VDLQSEALLQALHLVNEVHPVHHACRLLLQMQWPVDRAVAPLGVRRPSLHHHLDRSRLHPIRLRPAIRCLQRGYHQLVPLVDPLVHRSQLHQCVRG